MMFFLLLTIAFGILIFIACGTLVYALVKKKKSMLITAAILFFVGVVGGLFSGLAYSKSVYDYVKGPDFQHDARKGSEIVGQTVGSVSSGLANGASATLDDEAISKLAHKSATILGKSYKTMASGLDSTTSTKRIFLDQSLEGDSLALGRAEEHASPKTNDLRIFIDYNKSFKGKLRVTNYDQTGSKIDVAEKSIYAAAGQGRVEVFAFPYSDMGITTYYIVSKVP